ncbi:ROK family protein, partial [Enterococcus cecorum]|uniref:ROK family protein n=1 Tax=Enterococcus cecorum TaxID=44008 RepID=UPI001AD83DAC
QPLEENLQLPVSIENDAVCAGIAEMSLGVGKNVNNSIFIVIGTGIGGSIFINRKVYKGSHLFGGEFGLIKPYASKKLSLLATAVHKAEEYSEATGTEIDGKKLFELANAGDAVAQDYLNQMYDGIAQALYNIQVILDPEII